MYDHLENGRQNKCSVGQETSRPEVEKLVAWVSFQREKVFIPPAEATVRLRNENFPSRKRNLGREIFHQCTVGCFGPKTDILGVWGRSQKMTFGVPRG